MAEVNGVKFETLGQFLEDYVKAKKEKGTKNEHRVTLENEPFSGSGLDIVLDTCGVAFVLRENLTDLILREGEVEEDNYRLYLYRIQFQAFDDWICESINSEMSEKGFELTVGDTEYNGTIEEGNFFGVFELLSHFRIDDMDMTYEQFSTWSKNVITAFYDSMEYLEDNM